MLDFSAAGFQAPVTAFLDVERQLLLKGQLKRLLDHGITRQ